MKAIIYMSRKGSFMGYSKDIVLEIDYLQADVQRKGFFRKNRILQISFLLMFLFCVIDTVLVANFINLLGSL